MFKCDGAVSECASTTAASTTVTANVIFHSLHHETAGAKCGIGGSRPLNANESRDLRQSSLGKMAFKQRNRIAVGGAHDVAGHHGDYATLRQRVNIITKHNFETHKRAPTTSNNTSRASTLKPPNRSTIEVAMTAHDPASARQEAFRETHWHNARDALPANKPETTALQGKSSMASESGMKARGICRDRDAVGGGVRFCGVDAEVGVRRRRRRGEGCPGGGMQGGGAAKM
jgi:hypothetical protein